MSNYAENLLSRAKKQYTAKITVINGLDPFGGCPVETFETVPPVEAFELVAYLVLQINFIITQQYKSLEA